MSRDRDPIPRLGAAELTACKLAVIDGRWPDSYRALLKAAGLTEPPAHVRAEAAIMKRRHAAGDEDWRDGSKRSPLRFALP